MAQISYHDQSQKEKLDNNSLIKQYNDGQVSSQLEKSNHISQYNDFFTQILEKNVKLKIDSCLSALKKGGIVYDPSNFSQFTFSISKSVTVNLQIIKAEIKWGYFTMNVSILNNFNQSYFHYCQFRQGSFGKVFFLQHPTQSFVIKCISLDWKLKKSETIKRNAVKEFFISKICSALECGSKMVNFIGFDLIFSNSCIEFAMEKCYPLRNQSALIYQQMKMNLYLLHYFRIIHFDIKLDNIMFSRLHEKYVFIDFGLSDMLKEQMGWKYLLNFKGTPNFCSPQMTIAFGNQFKSYIDPYYNDIYCLRGSFNSIVYESSANQFEKQKISEFYRMDLIQIFQNKHNTLNNHINFDFHSKTKETFSHISVLKFKYSLCILGKYPDEQLGNCSDLNTDYIYMETIKFINEAFQLKILRCYYKEIIPKLTKQSMQFQWLRQKTKLTILNRDLKGTLTLEKKQKIIDYYEGIDTNKQIDNLIMFSFPDKRTIQQKIFDKNVNLETQLRFFLFMQYVNFTNNTCNVDNQERIQLIKKFNSFDFERQVFKEKMINRGPQNIDLFPFSELLNAFNIIISWYSSNQYQNQLKRDRVSTRIDVLFDIVEHMFFLNLITSQKLLLLLENIYKLPFLSPYYKLEFLLKIKHYNNWIIFVPHQKVIINHEQVDQFWRNKFHKLKLQLTEPALITLFNLLQSSRMLNFSEINQLFNNQYFNSIPQSLKFQLGFEYYKQSLYMTDYGQSSDLFEQLFSILPVQLKSKSFFFYNHLFLFLFSTEGEHLGTLQEIHGIFQKNLNDNNLTSQLITFKLLRLRQSDHQQRTKSLLHIIQLLNQNNMYFLDQVIIRFLNYHIHNIEWPAFIGSLRDFYHRVNFKKMLLCIPPVCYKKKIAYDYFIFKYQCSKRDRILLNSYKEEIKQFSIFVESQICQKCKYVFLSTLYQLSINNNFTACDRFQKGGMFYEFRKLEICYSINNNFYEDKNIAYIRYNNYLQTILEIMKHQNLSDQAFQIVKDLFYIIKQNGDIFIYFDFLQKSPDLVYITILTLHKNAVQRYKYTEDEKRLALKDLIDFIKSLLNINTIGYAAAYLDYLTLIFEKYIVYLLSNNSQFLKILAQSIGKQQQNGTIYSNVFYFACILRLNHEERQKYLVKIYQWWDHLPEKMLMFYQFNIYCLLLYRFPLYLIKNKLAFKGTSENPSASLNYRKKVFEQKKVLKLFIKIDTTSTQEKYKILKKFGLKVRKISEKCSKFGGPYFASNHRISIALIPRIKGNPSKLSL